MPIWGDGILISGYETCDDGNTVNFDGCTSLCVEETYSDRYTWYHNGTSPVTTCIDTCGDGFNVY